MTSNVSTEIDNTSRQFSSLCDSLRYLTSFLSIQHSFAIVFFKCILRWLSSRNFFQEDLLLCNFLFYANSSIVFGPNFRGAKSLRGVKSLRGQTASGGAPCPPGGTKPEYTMELTLEPKLYPITILRTVLYGEIIWRVDNVY